jgi:hypothetical protein
MSPALLRDVLQIDPIKPQRASRPKQITRLAIPLPPAAATPPSSPAPTTQPYDVGQPAALNAALYSGPQADDTE